MNREGVELRRLTVYSQSQEHQNVLCAHGIVDTLSSTLQSSVPKVRVSWV